MDALERYARIAAIKQEMLLSNRDRLMNVIDRLIRVTGEREGYLADGAHEQLLADLKDALAD